MKKPLDEVEKFLPTSCDSVAAELTPRRDRFDTPPRRDRRRRPDHAAFFVVVRPEDGAGAGDGGAVFVLEPPAASFSARRFRARMAAEKGRISFQRLILAKESLL
jgi:hypothetical protein